jgi:hypothetical protein
MSSTLQHEITFASNGLTYTVSKHAVIPFHETQYKLMSLSRFQRDIPRSTTEFQKSIVAANKRYNETVLGCKY